MVRLSRSFGTLGQTWGYEAVAFIKSKKALAYRQGSLLPQSDIKSTIYIPHKQKTEDYQSLAQDRLILKARGCLPNPHAQPHRPVENNNDITTVIHSLNKLQPSHPALLCSFASITSSSAPSKVIVTWIFLIFFSLTLRPLPPVWVASSTCGLD